MVDLDVPSVIFFPLLQLLLAIGVVRGLYGDVIPSVNNNNNNNNNGMTGSGGNETGEL